MEYVQPSDSPSYTYAYAAEERGFLKEQNIDMPPVIITRASAASVQAITAGPNSAVIGPVSTDSAMLAIDKGAPLKIIAGLTQQPPYGLIVRPEINSAADLKGKRCGASNAVSGEAPFLKAMVKSKYGLSTPDDYDLLIVGNLNDRSAALTTGAVQCLAITPPQNFDLVSKGMKEVANASTGAAFADFQFLVLIVNSNWASQNRDAVVRTVRAFEQGMEWMYTNYDKPDAIQMAVTRGKMPQEYAAQALKLYFGPGSNVQSRHLLPSLKGLEAVVDFMRQDGTFPKDQKVDWKKYLDMSYLEEATGQKFQMP
ncbi:MAG: ABC transporter substrate-binding protein [Chloroflexi bacterium]|nr:ABC transporter substrate-binding protein [Chloroflexota bacterium]